MKSTLKQAWLAVSLLLTAEALVQPPQSQTQLRQSSSPSSSFSSSAFSIRSVTAMRYTASKDDTTDDVNAIREDIERMKEEAKMRLEKLNEKLHAAEQELHSKQIEKNNDEYSGNNMEMNPVEFSSPKEQQQQQEQSLPTPTFLSFLEDDEADASDRLLEERMFRDSLPDIAPETKKVISLLDGSRWRLMLNIGREPGTWMPKTWGVSGERLLMNLEMEFTGDQLYESEDFLNGIGGAKVLHVIHDEANIAPSMKEGGRKVRVRNGGWRVAPGEGPLGTTVLRFYFELEEEARHLGSDVYCPLGRVYCTCGYFPMEQRMKKQQEGAGLKDSIRKQLRDLELQYESLQTEDDLDNNLISWSKVQRTKQMMDLRMQASKLSQKMNEARVQEPDKSLLRLSQDQSVGLTREGGVCCKVHKGLAIEYHILGKFEVSSMPNREHSDYRDLLP